ncbi:MAG TPA: sodium:proton antiporter [Ignisphaera sp.]|nr:sodium:proton antiporter [Ignisphaera sp.]
MWRDIAFALALILAIIALAYATTLRGLGPLPPDNLRNLAIAYLKTTYNPFKPLFTAMAPEAVTAIIWDYRGLDTLFETVVFYGAIIAALTLYREVYKERDVLPLRGLSLIVKRSTAVISIAILSVAAATALHGHLTPGGGFQAGAIAAVAPLVILVVFSKIFLESRGVQYTKLLTLRNLGLLGIGLTAIALILVGLALGSNAFIFQNQAKELARLSYPSKALDVPLGGSLWFFNLFEAIAVAAGFTLVFMVLMSSEELAKREVVGEEHGY